MANLGQMTVELDLDSKNLGKGVDLAKNKLGGMTSGLSKSVSGIQGAMGGLSGMFKGGLAFGAAAAAIGLVTSALQKLGQAMSTLVAEGIRYNASMEQNTIAFEVMLGNAKDAKKMVSEIAMFADITPFSTTGLTDAAKLLKQFGMETKDVMPTLRVLGDVSLGNEEKMKGLAYAYSQIMSTGKLMQQDLNQLVNNGFNPLQEIAKRTGQDFAKLNKDFRNSDIEISAKAVALAFQSARAEGGSFFKGMEKLGKSYDGQMSTLMDTAKRLGGKLTEPFFKFLSSGVIPKMQKQLEGLFPYFTTFGEVVMKTSNVVIRGLVATSNIFGDFARQLVLAFGGDSMYFVESAATIIGVSMAYITGVIQDFIHYIKQMVMILPNFFNSLGNSFKGMGQFLAGDMEAAKGSMINAQIFSDRVKANAKALTVTLGTGAKYAAETNKSIYDSFTRLYQSQKGSKKIVAPKIEEPKINWGDAFKKEMGASSDEMKKAKDDADKLNDKMKELTQTIKDQAMAFANFVGTFDKVQKIRISSMSVFQRLKGQVIEMRKWKDALSSIGKRLGETSTFYQDLVKQGPKAAGEIMAVSRMDNAMLKSTEELFNEKIQMGLEVATIQQAGMAGVKGNAITINITGNNIKDTMDVDIIAEQMAKKLMFAGVY